MSRRSPRVVVIGAGVSGLTTAVCLAEAGLDVTVRADLPPERTTSAAAGALWGAHLAGADERVPSWAAVTLRQLRELAHDPATGVQLTHGLAASRRPLADPPEFTAGAGPLARCDPATLPAGYQSGWRYCAPLVAMPVYLGYLAARLGRAGGRLEPGGRLASLTAAVAPLGADIVVNCAGIGARELVPDASVVPERGQVVWVANPGISDFFVGEAGPDGATTYFFPHRSGVVLGGTFEKGDWRTEPDPATADRIRRDCAAVEPRLRGAPVLAHLVGLRPVRPAVRLEAERAPNGRLVVHNYGHGGAGVTLSWGCAAEAADAVLEAAGQP